MKTVPGLTVCMIVRDERDNLQELLSTVVENVDDVIVVDTGSTDGSEEVAERRGARVFHRPWDDDFAAARNRGLEEVRTSHAMWLDADDRMKGEDLRRIRDAVVAEPGRGLMLLLVNESPDPSAVSSCWQLRVFPARPEHRFSGRVHEQVHDALERTGTPVTRLDVTVTHTGYARNDEVIRKARRNYELLRRERNDGGENDINVLFHFLKAASRCGELEAAVATAERILNDPPAGTPMDIVQATAVQLGRLEQQRGRHEQAVDVLRSAVDRKPDDPLARFFLGELLQRRGDLTGAITQLEAARVAPIRFDTLPVPVAGLTRAIRMQLGHAYEVVGRHADAVDVYREAFSPSPDDIVAGRSLARSLIGAEDRDEARRVLDGLPAHDDPRHETALLRALLAFDDHDDEEAATLFTRIAGESPRTWIAHLHLGHLRLRGGDLPGSLTHYERAREIADNPETRVGLAAALLESDRVAETLDHLAEAVDQCRNRPLPPGTEALAGEALLRFGRPEEARSAFERHLARGGPDARVVSRLADCYRVLGAPEAARVGYREALRLNPDLSEAERGLRELETVH